jgi:hypothetical protein
MRPVRNPVLAEQQDDCLLSLRHNPAGMLLSADLWRSAGYLFGYQLVSGTLFAAVVASVSLAIGLSVTIVAAPLALTAAAAVISACAGIERARLRMVYSGSAERAHRPAAGGSAEGARRPAAGRGSWRSALARWGERSTWRDLGYLAGLWPALLMLDTLVLSVWATFLAGITLPLWYSHVSGACTGACSVRSVPGVMIGYFPHGPHGLGSYGIYADSLPTALLVAAGCAVLFLLMNYVLVATARLQALIARAALGQPSDPLAEARAVLTGPRPLGPLIR